MSSTEAKQRILSLLREGTKSFDQIAQSLWLNEQDLVKLLRELKRDHSIIRNTDGNYELFPETTKKHTLVKRRSITPRYQTRILAIVFSVIAVLTVCVSTRNTTKYLFETYPPLWGFLVSLSIALFLVSAFSAVIYFFSKGGWFILVGCILIPIWVVVLMCSMSATTIGMYNTQLSYAATTVSDDQKLYNLYGAQEKTIVALIETKQNSIERYNKLLAYYDTEEKIDAHKKDYNAIDANIRNAETYITQQTAILTDIGLKKEALLSKAQDISTDQRDAYAVMGTWWSLEPNMIRFIISVLYAIFIDIIAPISTGLALFLNNSRR